MQDALRVEGHTLVGGGAPFTDQGNRVARDRHWGAGGQGRGRCSCGVLSEVLPTKAKRMRWHREHKAAVSTG